MPACVRPLHCRSAVMTFCFVFSEALGGLGGGGGFSPSSSSNARRAERRLAEETAAPSTGEVMQMAKTI